MKGFKPFGAKNQPGHKFPSGFGFSGSTGKVRQVRPYQQRVPKTARTVVRKAVGGPVHLSPHESAVVKRTQPVTQFDVEHGGKGPLRPGFMHGGFISRPPVSPPPTKSPMGGRPGPSPVPPVAPRIGMPRRPGPLGRYARGGKTLGKSEGGEVKLIPRRKNGEVTYVLPRKNRPSSSNPYPSQREASHTGKASHSALSLLNPKVREEMGLARGGSAKRRMGYREGGAVSAGQAKQIAQRVVGEHVRYPAPRGHKGLERAMKR